MGIGECYGTSAIYGGADHREVDVLVGRGSTAIEACRQIGISALVADLALLRPAAA